MLLKTWAEMDDAQLYREGRMTLRFFGFKDENGSLMKGNIFVKERFRNGSNGSHIENALTKFILAALSE